MIPAVLFNMAYLYLLLGIIFSILTFIPLYLIAKKYTNKINSIIITTIIILTCNILNNEFLLGKTQISIFLTTWLLYLFLDIKNKKRFILSSIIFLIMISNEYVFFYLSPFIILYIYFTFKKQKIFIKKTIQFFTPAILIFILLLSINIINYGFTMEGTFSGYRNIFNHRNDNPILEIYPSTIPMKLKSIITKYEIFKTVFYYLLFIFTFITIFIKKDKIYQLFKKKEIIYYKLLILNFIIFFCLPAMTWQREYLTTRYLSYFIPVYLILTICILLKIINTTLNQSKLIKNI